MNGHETRVVYENKGGCFSHTLTVDNTAHIILRMRVLNPHLYKLKTLFMKTLLHKCALFCLVSTITVTLLAVSRYETEPKFQNKRVKLIEEDTIDFHNNVVEQTVGDAQRNDSYNKILVNCVTKSMVTAIDSIELIHFNQLRDSAIRINPSYSGRYILALRFIYGMDESKNMILMYQPLFLKRVTANGIKANVEYKADTSLYCYIYNHSDTSRFQPIDKSFVKAAIKKYKENISFKTGSQKGQPVCRTFNNATDSTGDIKRTVFSFQELNSVVKDHEAEILYILNAAEVIRANHTDYLKHILLLGSENFHLESRFHSGIFYKKYGNLSHLCPPSCGVTYNYDLKK